MYSGAVRQFGKDFKMTPKLSKTLISKTLETPLGAMLVIADEEGIYLLEFTDKPDLNREIQTVLAQTEATLSEGNGAIIAVLEQELTAYFAGMLKEFKTPVHFLGTPFQQSIWSCLQTIPYGQTRSYSQQAVLVGKPSAFRAVANAHGANHLALIVPCHRVIKSDGQLGGYSCGIERKQWLLEHEKQHS